MIKCPHIPLSPLLYNNLRNHRKFNKHVITTTACTMIQNQLSKYFEEISEIYPVRNPPSSDVSVFFSFFAFLTAGDVVSVVSSLSNLRFFGTLGSVESGPASYVFTSLATAKRMSTPTPNTNSPTTTVDRYLKMCTQGKFIISDFRYYLDN